jgi:hypothetical protein
VVAVYWGGSRGANSGRGVRGRQTSAQTGRRLWSRFRHETRFPDSLLCKLLCMLGGQSFASNAGTPVFPRFLLCKILCKMLCRLLCKLLCRVSVACMHNKLRGCGVGRPAHNDLRRRRGTGRHVAGGVTRGHLRRHRQWVGVWRAGWVRRTGSWPLEFRPPIRSWPGQILETDS